MSNFFRKDLDLKNHWWHRLLSVAFFIALASSVGAVFLDSHWPMYSNVGKLSDRLDYEIRIIGSLVGPEEKIAVNEHNIYASSYNQNGGWLLNQDYYCSKNIAAKVEEVGLMTGINFYKGNIDLITLKDFKDYLVMNGAECIGVLKLDNPQRYGDIKKALSWGISADDMSVWQPSLMKSFFEVTKNLLLVVVGFSIVVVFYYKVFLYIIFGNTKSGK
jgi:hypothetical protein